MATQTIWEPEDEGDDPPIALIYSRDGTIQHRIWYYPDEGEDRGDGRKTMWYCDEKGGNMWPLQRSPHLLRFHTEGLAGLLGPGIKLTEHGRDMADNHCKCNTGRRLEESPLPPRPVGDGLNSRQRREKRRAEEAAERERIEREAREAAERKRKEELEATWQAAYDERTRAVQRRIAEIAAERAAAEKVAAKRKRSKAKAKAPVKPAKSAAPKKAAAKKASKAKPKKRGKKK